MKDKIEISLDLYGNFACFTRPYMKLDRVTYDVITPSAARGILCSILCKPKKFYYEITKIEIMNEIKHIDIKKNELKDGKIKMDTKQDDILSIYREDDITQKNNRYLKDVYYRIYANIVKMPEYQYRSDENILTFKREFDRCVNYGKCKKQPYFGTKECICYFEPVNTQKYALQKNIDFGICLYDIFDITKNTILDKKNKDDVVNITFYHAIAENGVITIPPFNEIIKGGTAQYD